MIKTRDFFLVAFLASCLCGVTQAQTSVWKISKSGSHFYLGGTVHVLSEDQYPLPGAFQKAYEQSQTLIFEVDFKEANSPATQAHAMSVMTGPEDNTLRSSLKAETYEKLKAFLTERRIPIDFFSRFKPWGVALIVSVMEYERLGEKPEFGVDQHFFTAAVRDGKTTLALETSIQQLDMIASLGTVDPDETILAMINEVDDLARFSKIAIQHWRAGELELLAQDKAIEEMKKYPEVYETLLLERNRNWMTRLKALTDTPEIEFVLVGALHIPDKGGLLDLLVAEGFQVKRAVAD